MKKEIKLIYDENGDISVEAKNDLSVFFVAMILAKTASSLAEQVDTFQSKNPHLKEEDVKISDISNS